MNKQFAEEKTGVSINIFLKCSLSLLTNICKITKRYHLNPPVRKNLNSLDTKSYLGCKAKLLNCSRVQILALLFISRMLWVSNLVFLRP